MRALHPIHHHRHVCSPPPLTICTDGRTDTSRAGIETIFQLLPLCQRTWPGPAQSQFRFDNECYLNLPDNHKRVSNAPLTIYENPNVEMVKAIAAQAAAAADANALGDVTEDPDKKQHYENLSSPDKGKAESEGTDVNNQLVATDDVDLPTVSLLFMISFICFY